LLQKRVAPPSFHVLTTVSCFCSLFFSLAPSNTKPGSRAAPPAPSSSTSMSGIFPPPGSLFYWVSVTRVGIRVFFPKTASLRHVTFFSLRAAQPWLIEATTFPQFRPLLGSKFFSDTLRGLEPFFMTIRTRLSSCFIRLFTGPQAPVAVRLDFCVYRRFVFLDIAAFRTNSCRAGCLRPPFSEAPDPLPASFFPHGSPPQSRFTPADPPDSTKISVILCWDFPPFFPICSIPTAGSISCKGDSCARTFPGSPCLFFRNRVRSYLPALCLCPAWAAPCFLRLHLGVCLDTPTPWSICFRHAQASP